MSEAGLWKYAGIRGDVFEKSLDDKTAPSLSEVVLGGAPEVYVDSRKFVESTYLTDSMKGLLREVLDALASESGRLIILPSAFGGGKTHSMILLYHLARNPGSPEFTQVVAEVVEVERAKQLSDALRGMHVIVIDGTNSKTAPSPIPGEELEEGGVKVRTLWGYLAWKIGHDKYERIRYYDEELISPEKSKLLEVLSGERVLVLIDELGPYYRRFKKAAADKLVKYADQVVVFLRMLSECVKEASVVVVLSLPAEPTDKGLESEVGYEDFVKQVERELARVAIRVERPIATSIDFAGVLRKRLFSEVGDEGARLVARRLRSLAMEYQQFVKDVSEELEKHYPFHPLFIMTLRELVERNKNLQKTRDALRIARKVLRNMYKKQGEALLIMPTDIDPQVEEIRTAIITESYVGFDLVLTKVINKVKEIPPIEGLDPEVFRDLAYRLVLYVFLKTYVYDPHLEPRSEFPGKVEVVTGVYDPLRYEQYLVSPVEAAELLDKLATGGIEYRMPHFYGREGRFWVTRLLDINERVEKKAEKIDDFAAMSLIMGRVESLLTKPYEGREELELELFTAKPEVLKEPALLDLDLREYVPVVVVEPLPEVKEGVYAEEPLYDLIYYKKSGSQKSPRRYANSMAVLLSNRADAWREILKTAKKIIACDQLMKTIQNEVDPKSFKYIKGELNSLKENLEKGLRRNLVTSYFNLIAYPDRDRSTNVVRVSSIRDYSSKTLAELAERALISSGKAIERKDMGFESLVYYLSSEHAQKWTARMRVQDVINAFLENPALPMIRADYIKEAIRDGLRRLLIGIERGGRVYFKSIDKEGPEKLLGGIEDTDIVLPQEEAAERQISELSSVAEEKVVNDTIIKQYYVVVRDNREIPIYELKNRFPEDYIIVFINSEVKLRKVEERRGFDLVIEPLTQEFRVSELPELVTARVFVKSVGGFADEVVIEPESGEVKPSKGTPDFEADWVIKAPQESGEHVFRVKASAPSRGLQREASLKLVVKKELLCRNEPGEKLLQLNVSGEVEPASLLKLLGVVKTSVRGTKLVRKGLLIVEPRDKEVSVAKRRTSVQFEEVTLDDVETIAKALITALRLLADIRFTSLELVVRGEGMVEDLNKLKSAHEDIKLEGIRVEYCW